MKTQPATQGRAHEVLFPVVANGGGALLRVVARNERPPPHPSGLDPVISELMDNGLYSAGQTAWAALRRCGQRRSGWLAAREAFLGVVNPGDLPGLTPVNARSAELGLALALALQRANSPLREVIATGALDTGGGNRDVAVTPVAHIEQKLKLIASEFRQPGAAPVPPLLLLPCYEPDGTLVETRHADILAELARFGIKVQFVETLRQALEHVSAQRLARHPAERAVKLASGLLALLAFAATSAWLWFQQPIEARFLPVTLSDGTTSATPLRVSLSSAEGVPEALEGCPVGPAARIATGEALALRFSTAPHTPSRWFGTHAAVVVVGSETGVKIVPAIEPSGFEPDTAQGFIARVIDPPEENLLAVLMRPARPFDLAHLEAQLRDRIDPLDPAVRLRAAENLLPTMARGVLFHRFTSTGGTAPCE